MTDHHRTTEWARTTRIMRPRIEAQLPLPCVDCGRPVHREQKWQVGHIVPVTEAKRMGWSTAQMNAPTNLGPSHAKGPGQRACNQIAGGKLGAHHTKVKKLNDRRLPAW